MIRGLARKSFLKSRIPASTQLAWTREFTQFSEILRVPAFKESIRLAKSRSSRQGGALQKLFTREQGTQGYNSGVLANQEGDPMKVSWVVCLASLLAVPAFGQNGWNDDAQICKDQSGDPAIAACTRAIESGQLSQASLAVTYMNRGVEWRHKGEDDRAMADYNQAIQLNPNDAMTYNDRGNVWVDKGDFEHAMADYNQSIRLDPNYIKAYSNRGVIRYEGGNWADAAADFARAHESNAKDGHTVLWQALVGMHQPDSGWAARLAEEAKGLSQDWPMPLVSLYEGQITPDQLLAAAGDLTADPDRLCDVGFYFGEWKLSHGQAQEAVAYLKKAQSNCPHYYSEYETAVAELKKLGSQ